MGVSPVACQSSVCNEADLNVRTGKVSRTSLIYHFGLEGLGELRLESETESDVSDHLEESQLARESYSDHLLQTPQGIEGEVVLIGSSADLGDFRIRIVDRKFTARPQYIVARSARAKDPVLLDPAQILILRGNCEVNTTTSSPSLPSRHRSLELRFQMKRFGGSKVSATRAKYTVSTAKLMPPTCRSLAPPPARRHLPVHHLLGRIHHATI